MHPPHDPLKFSLVGDRPSQPLVLFLGEGDGDRFRGHLASPDVSAALLSGVALEDGALADIADAAQPALESPIALGEALGRT